jgi:hypothetical protein
MHVCVCVHTYIARPVCFSSHIGILSRLRVVVPLLSLWSFTGVLALGAIILQVELIA